jgi:hypothetical protein
MNEPFREAVRIVLERLHSDPDAFISGPFMWLRSATLRDPHFWNAFTSVEATALREGLNLVGYKEFNKRVLATVFQEDRSEDSND